MVYIIQIIAQHREYMQHTQLTPNGIANMLKGQIVVLQIIKIKIYDKKGKQAEEGEQYILADVSDGFSFFHKCMIPRSLFPTDKIAYSVVQMKCIVDGKARQKVDNYLKSKNISLLIENQPFHVLYSNLTTLIGDPIDHKDYIQNGNKNIKGNRTIPVEENSDDQLEATLDECKGKGKQIKNNRESVSVSNQDSISQTNNRGIANKNVSVEKPAGKQKQPPAKPIIKLQQKKRPSIKPEVRLPAGDYEQIRNLHLGLQNFTIMGRLLFIWPVKLITNKKGAQSQLLNMCFGDKTGMIMCTVFGDNAQRYSSLQHDQVYSISGAYITETSYRGVSETKLNFNDGTKVMRIQNNDIPEVQKFCLNLKELADAEKGKVLAVICLIKDGELIQFQTKAGNKCLKKVISMLDLDNQLEASLTLFGDKAEMPYNEGVYALYGVEVDEYQGNKQYKAALAFLARPLTSHRFNKHMKKVDQIAFTHITTNKTKKASVSTFSELLEKGQSLQDNQSIWSQVICYLKAIRIGGNFKTTYMSCPNCKKKVLDAESASCGSCGKYYAHSKFRYILNICLVDDHDSIWASSYDDTGQHIMAGPEEDTFSADQFAQLDQQGGRNRAHSLRYKRLKLKIVSNKQQYNGERRLKHKVNKVLSFNAAEQSNLMLQRIHAAIKLI